jgi:hypothetical protein
MEHSLYMILVNYQNHTLRIPALSQQHRDPHSHHWHQCHVEHHNKHVGHGCTSLHLKHDEGALRHVQWKVLREMLSKIKQFLCKDWCLFTLGNKKLGLFWEKTPIWSIKLTRICWPNWRFPTKLSWKQIARKNNRRFGCKLVNRELWVRKLHRGRVFDTPCPLVWHGQFFFFSNCPLKQFNQS